MVEDPSYRKLLTIQDVSCVGQCSATVALPIVSACGVECAVLPSAVLSNHTGPQFTSWSFRDLTDDMSLVAAEWKKSGVLFDAVYTGYVVASQIDPILEITKEFSVPGAIRVVDPVMGDDGKQYAGFSRDFPENMKRLCYGADFILPNLTETSLLLGHDPVLSGYDEKYIEDSMKGLHDLGVKNVIMTGVSFEPDRLGFAYSDGKNVMYDFNDRIDGVCHGTGDIFASVFSGAVLRGKKPFAAASLAADIVCDAIRLTPADHYYGTAFERALPRLVSAFA